MRRSNVLCCQINKIRLDRVVSILSCIQVIRTLWQIWGSFDNDWPSSVDPIIMPTVYIACALTILVMIVSVSATWSAYKAHLWSLNFNWWLYYTLTIISFLNNCANLSILCITKDRFIGGCVRENAGLAAQACEDCDAPGPCTWHWEESVVRASVSMILDLAINVAFAYALYRCKAQHQRTSISQVRPSSPPPYPAGMTSYDEDGFQVVELK